jgi:hypothetical protein
MVVSWVTGREDQTFEEIIKPKVADYLESICTLIVVATFDLPRCIPLDCDLNLMPNVEPFRTSAAVVLAPLLEQTKGNMLPRGSFRD